jgi:hypothetical protein
METKEALIYMNKSGTFSIWNWNRFEGSRFTFFNLTISTREIVLIILNFEIECSQKR